MIYLDYNATTPIDPAVADVMQPLLRETFGNPSSSHRFGRAAKAVVEGARAQVAACIGADAEEITFTSGGSESNNLALVGILESGGHVVSSAIEHPAITEVLRALRRRGIAEHSIVGVDRQGRIDVAQVLDAITDKTRVVTVMLANNEVGTLQPIAELAAECRKRNVLVHTDAAQAVGKIEVDVRTLGVDLLTIAGHKLYGPKGIGALYVRRGVQLSRQIHGANHERGLRAGTENVILGAGLGKACELVSQRLTADIEHSRELRGLLQDKLQKAHPPAVVNGHPEQRLPNTLSIALVGADADAILKKMDDDLAASAGAACHSDDVKMSHVLAAMEIAPSVARSTLRLSVGRFTTRAEVEKAATLLADAAAQLTA